jgi:hypothetical protein
MKYFNHIEKYNDLANLLQEDKFRLHIYYPWFRFSFLLKKNIMTNSKISFRKLKRIGYFINLFYEASFPVIPKQNSNIT